MGRCGGGGGTLDRVVMGKEWKETYVRMKMNKLAKTLHTLVIMNNNDITQTKYIAYMDSQLDKLPSISDKIHIVIENVKTNMDTSSNDIQMTKESTTIHINDKSISNVKGTWTSTILPDESRVDLTGEVIGISGDIVTVKCPSDTNWPGSVFNRLPCVIEYYPDDGFSGRSSITFGVNQDIHQIFCPSYTTYLSLSGFEPNYWSNNNRLRISTNSDSNRLIFGSYLFSIDSGLPTNFVNHWVNTIHAELLMIGVSGNHYYGFFVPPDS